MTIIGNFDWNTTLTLLCIFTLVVVDCGVINAPANGFRVGSSFTYNKVLAFDCDPGYKLVGTQYRKCQENGLWSGSAPTCVGK